MAVVLDSSEWRQAVTQYAAASGKTIAASEDRFLAKLAYRASQIAPVADRQRIMGLKGEYKLSAWWALRKYGTSPRVARMFKRDTVSVSKRGRVSRRKSKERTRGRMVRYTEEEARLLAKQQIGRRSSSVGFVRSYFQMLLAAIRGTAQGGRGAWIPGRANGSRATGNRHRTSPKGTGFTVSYSPARKVGASVSASGLVSFNFKSNLVTPPGASAAQTERLLQSVVDRAMPWAIADTMHHVDRQVAKEARRFSAR